MSIGDKLKALRGVKTLEEIATDIGITKQALSNYENDMRIPRDEVKIKLANYYGVSIEAIFFEQKRNELNTKE